MSLFHRQLYKAVFGVSRYTQQKMSLQCYWAKLGGANVFTRPSEQTKPDPVTNTGHGIPWTS